MDNRQKQWCFVQLHLHPRSYRQLVIHRLLMQVNWSGIVIWSNRRDKFWACKGKGFFKCTFIPGTMTRCILDQCYWPVGGRKSLWAHSPSLHSRQLILSGFLNHLPGQRFVNSHRVKCDTDCQKIVHLIGLFWDLNKKPVGWTSISIHIQKFRMRTNIYVSECKQEIKWQTL